MKISVFKEAMLVIATSGTSNCVESLAYDNIAMLFEIAFEIRKVFQGYLNV